MTNFAGWISPAVLLALGWTLLHFVWQGVGFAALFAVAMTICRSPQIRYVLAVATLGLMMASPVITFLWLNREAVPAVQSGEHGALTWAETSTQNATALSGSVAPAAVSQTGQPAAMLWLVEAWFLGVLLLSLRTAGGLLVIARMRRKEIKPVTGELYEKCLSLQKKMGLDRLIRYCECHRLDAPAVLGWFRPAVLLPVRALTGLTAEQMQVVIAHELAHIRRFDSFVNFFQIAVETVLFYHPAVWWVSQRIRVEREVCCDHEALAVCGDAVNYARALTLMEEWRTAPSLLMAANRGPLAERIWRLLGLNGASDRTRVAGLGVSLVCLATALLAGHAFLGVAQASLDKGPISKQEPSGDSVIIVKPTGVATGERGAQATKPSGTEGQSAAKPKAEKDKEQQPAGDENKKQSYLDAMEAAGFKNLSVDEIIAMKVQGITPGYIKGIRELGFKPTADELIGMKVQGITPDYIHDMQAFHSNLTVDELIGMKVQGVTPQYIREFRELGLQPDPDETVGMKVQGVTPEYLKELRATGLKPGIDELIGMKVQGITPEYVKAMQAAGFKDLDSDELIGAKVQGITPEFIEKARQHGFQNLTLDKLMALKHADIL
jgi:beta-lactamase regulating signal transducer with metallopeptidase domain